MDLEKVFQQMGYKSQDVAEIMKRIQLLEALGSGGAIERELERMGQQSEENVVNEIAQNYMILIHSLHLEGENHTIRISQDDCYSASIDGKLYDFDLLVRHDQSELTEAKMAIEAWMTEENQEAVERRLNEILNEY